MKVCRKILYLFLVSIISMSLTACQSNNSNSDNSSNNNESTSSDSNDNNQSKFDQYNILSFSKIELDKKPKLEGDQNYYIKVKIKNNSDKTIRVISPEMSIYDKDNTLIDSTYPQQQSAIKPNQSFYMDSVINANEDIDHIEINKYSYYIGNTFYDVDILSKVIDIAQ